MRGEQTFGKTHQAGEGMKRGYLDAVVYNAFLYWAEVHFDSGCLYSVVHPQ